MNSTPHTSRHLVFAVLDGAGALVHGGLVHGAEDWAAIPCKTADQTLPLPSGALRFVQAIVDSAEAVRIGDVATAQCVADLTALGLQTPIALQGSRTVLMDGFGRSSRPSVIHTAEVFPTLVEEDWKLAFELVENQFGVQLGRTPDLVGAFQIFDRAEGQIRDAVVQFAADRDEGFDGRSRPTSFVLQCREAGTYRIHVELKLGGRKVFARLIDDLLGTEPRQVEAVPFDAYTLSAFDGAGNLVQSEGFPLLTQIGINMSSIGTTHRMTDDLAESSQGLDRRTRKAATRVETRSTNRSLIGVRDDAFDRHQIRTRALIGRVMPRSENDRWFARGVAHEIGVIEHFNRLIDGGRVGAATIVDPFFGSHALERVLTRLESVDVELTVITSLRDVDPETNEPNDRLMEALRSTLVALDSDLPAATRRLRLLNLVDGGGQAFHDRYLALESHEGEPEVYLLSNSLNRMAGRWPFCMSKLDAATAREANRYIAGLARGRDVSGSTSPVIDFEWPTP